MYNQHLCRHVPRHAWAAPARQDGHAIPREGLIILTVAPAGSMAPRCGNPRISRSSSLSSSSSSSSYTPGGSPRLDDDEDDDEHEKTGMQVVSKIGGRAAQGHRGLHPGTRIVMISERWRQKCRCFRGSAGHRLGGQSR